MNFEISLCNLPTPTLHASFLYPGKLIFLLFHLIFKIQLQNFALQKCHVSIYLYLQAHVTFSEITPFRYFLLIFPIKHCELLNFPQFQHRIAFIKAQLQTVTEGHSQIRGRFLRSQMRSNLIPTKQLPVSNEIDILWL